MKEVPCFICGDAMTVGETVKGKPVLGCDPCATQIFIRGSRGVRMFSEKFGADWKTSKPVPVAEVKPAPAPKPAPKSEPAKGKEVPPVEPAKPAGGLW